MRTAFLAPVALAVLASFGCRCGGATNQELVERELRFQETELYRLQDQLDDACEKLDAAERENASLRRQLAGGGSTGTSPPSPSSELTLPHVELPGIEGPGAPAPHHRGSSKTAPRELPVPTVEPGVEMPSSSDPAPPGSPPSQELPPPSEAPRFDAQGASHQAPAGDGRPTGLEINKELTVWRANGERPEADLISVVFEPRDPDGQFVKATGEVSIVALDPAVSGPGARVARWDFRNAEAQRHLHAAGHGQGYHFELRWPGRAPVHDQVEMFIRLKTSDGQRLVTNATIRLRDGSAGRGGGGMPPEEADRVASGARAQQADEDMLAARDGRRPRRFSKLRGGNSSSAAPASPTQPDADGSLNISVPDGGAGPVASSGGRGEMSVASKPGKLLDRSRLRGGPGMFDGSRIRSLTGSRDSKPPDDARSRGEAPVYGGGSPAGERGGEAPPFTGSSGAGSNAADPGSPAIEIPEPLGAPPASDVQPGEADEPSSSTRTARPVWRPYR